MEDRQTELEKLKRKAHKKARKKKEKQEKEEGGEDRDGARSPRARFRSPRAPFRSPRARFPSSGPPARDCFSVPLLFDIDLRLSNPLELMSRQACRGGSTSPCEHQVLEREVAVSHVLRVRTCAAEPRYPVSNLQSFVHAHSRQSAVDVASSVRSSQMGTQLHSTPQIKGLAVDRMKNGSQHTANTPTITPSVVAAFCSRLKMEMFRRSRFSRRDKAAQSSTTPGGFRPCIRSASLVTVARRPRRERSVKRCLAPLLRAALKIL
ncbi:hypothetical protein EYF80_013048 [Liparis tanakae]|uniref:Uncharacterized protein n=1 Tax=Liparis tanakae TaxID=230148 RepID=A0A4Z2IFH6_9TELE|nr:hypothetical protein EYF80_013048 [Liparis tanakae]